MPRSALLLRISKQTEVRLADRHFHVDSKLGLLAAVRLHLQQQVVDKSQQEGALVDDAVAFSEVKHVIVFTNSNVLVEKSRVELHDA